MKSPWLLRVWLVSAVLALAPAGQLTAADERAAAAREQLDKQIAALIDQLGAAEYPVRQRAQQQLIELGFDAFDALCEAETSDDPEIAMQASYLVRMIRVEWTRDDDPRQIQSILKDYEIQSDERRLIRLRQLAELPADQGLPWLCRAVRFEKSPVLSKQAALAIIGQDRPTDEAGWTRRAELINQALEHSRRPAAGWVLAYLKAHSDPRLALAAWSELVDRERRTLDEHPQETTSAIVMDLLRRKVDLLDAVGQPDAVLDVLRQMVACERGDASSLGELVDWLGQRKAWSVIDEVATRFAASFDLDAVLLYTLCEARLAQGDRQRADQTAEKALKLNADNTLEHLLVAERLMERGLTEWSDRELRHVIAASPVASPASIKARMILAESLHDRQRDDEAGSALKTLVDAVDSDPNVMQQVRLLLQPDRKVDYLRARMNFYYSCFAGREHDLAAQRKYLAKALEQEPTDLDVLIATYKLGDDDPARRANLQKLIKNVVDQCRTEIDDAPDEPINYNELAWLVANTEGDLDEAIRFSQKSVELVRAAAASAADSKRVGQHLDTLAHCYFAKGDLENAVRSQTEAVKLDPHTQAISRQLGVFREALAKQQAGGK